jgi:hypothetical protein
MSFPTTPASEEEARAQMQELFNQIKTYINTVLITGLESVITGSSGAEKIGSAPISGVAGETPRSQIADIYNQMQTLSLGGVTGGSITDYMLGADVKVGSLAELTTTVKTSIVAAINELVSSVGGLSGLTTTAKTSIVAAINELVSTLVTTAKIAGLAVTEPKLAANAVTTTKMADAAVTMAKLESAVQTKLAAERTRKITVSSSAPSGGSDGDIWIKV